MFSLDSAQMSFVQAAKAKHGGIFVISGNILGSDREQQEGFHVPHPT